MRGVVRIAATLALGLTLPGGVAAQSGTSPRPAEAAQLPAGSRTGNAPVMLEVRPRAGDTVSVRVEHSLEMTGTRRIADRDSTMRVASSMVMLARTIVESVEPTGSIVVMRTDSIGLESTGEEGMQMRDDARRRLEGATSRLRILTDGTAESLDGAMGPDGASLLAVMPATLPRKAVRVGDRWTQSMPMPSAAGRSAGGEVRASFRLDSLTGNGRFAWISMRGTLKRDEPAAGGGTGAERPGSMSGTLSGGLKLDRRRGWVMDSHTTMVVRSVIGLPDSAGPPLRVTVKISQRMRAVEKD